MSLQTYDKKLVGDRIRRRRKERLLTQAQLAELVGIDSQFCGDIERGKSGMSIDTMLTFCDALELSPTALLIGTDEIEYDSSDATMLQLNAALSDCTEAQRNCVLQMIREFLRRD